MSTPQSEHRPFARRAVTIVVMVLFAASLGFNVLLIGKLVGAFRSVQAARIFPLGFVEGDPRVAAPVQAGRERPIMELIGDSRAYLWQSEVWNKAFEVVNHAHGGQTSKQVLLQIKERPQPGVSVSVVQVGINDLHPLGVMAADTDRVVAALKENLREIVATLLARSQLVVISTIFPAGDVPLQRLPVWSDVTRAKIIEVNAAIAAIAASSQRVVVLDAYALLGSKEHARLLAQYADDDFFLHVNAAAYAALNEELDKLLRQHGLPGFAD
jgi:lysophospholipase L1-like esterase